MRACHSARKVQKWGMKYLIALLMLSSLPLRAHIGDTEQEVIKSIGDAPFMLVKSGQASSIVFYKDSEGVQRGYIIFQNKCLCEMFNATREQVQGILSKYGEWELTRSGERPIWKLKKTNIVASYKRKDGTLMIAELDKLEQSMKALEASVDWLKDLPFR